MTPAITLSGHTGLEITPSATSPNDTVSVFIGEHILMSAGDRCSGPMGLDAIIRAADAIRITNANNLDVSTSFVGNNGLDAGTVQPNTDYYLWGMSDGTNVQYRFSTAIPNAWPVMPAGYLYGAACYWNRTDANGHLLRLAKQDYEVSYVQGTAPAVASGLYPSSTFIPPVDKVSPTGGGFNTFRVVSGTAGKQVVIGCDAATADWETTGQNLSFLGQVRINGYAGGVYAYSSDPGFILNLTGFTDTV